MNKSKLSTRDITTIAIFSAIIGIVSQLSIPMPTGVPLTLQSFIIPLVGVLLGAKKGTIATCVYILIGAIGVPVFANFSSGFGAILGPTGGFIISFPILAYTAGIGYKKSKPVFFLFLSLGAIINYTVGLFFFKFVTEYDLITSFVYSVLPYIPTTIIKIVLLTLLSEKIKNRFTKLGVMNED